MTVNLRVTGHIMVAVSISLFFDTSHHNTINMTNINVTGNRNYDAVITEAPWDLDATGGGGMILYQSGDLGRNRVCHSRLDIYRKHW